MSERCGCYSEGYNDGFKDGRDDIRDELEEFISELRLVRARVAVNNDRMIMLDEIISRLDGIAEVGNE